METYYGELFDGLSTTPLTVVLKPDTDGLAIRLPDGSSYACPYKSIRTLEKTAAGFRCTLPSNTPEAQTPPVLCFTHEDLHRELRRHIDATRAPVFRIFSKIGTLKIWQLLLLTVAALSLFIGLLYFFLIRAYLLTPLSYDLHLGRTVDSTLANFYEPCSTPPLDSFLDKAMARLCLPSDNFQHRVIILNDTTRNAIAIPGGTIYLFKGLLEQSSSPDEILGILSHEIAHSERRHTVRQIIQGMGVAYIISLTVGIAIEGFDMLEGLESTLEMSSTLFMLRYSRTFEREADSLAIIRLHKTGLKVGPLDTLLTRISPPARARDRILAFFSTHPLIEERAKRFQDARAMETFSADTSFDTERALWDTVKNGCPQPQDSTPVWRKFLR